MSSFILEKQLIFGEQTKSEVIHPWYPEHSVIDNCAITEVGYDGRENVCTRYDAMGEMKNFYSNEIPDTNYETSADNAQFEDGFFKIPAVIETQTPVYRLYEDGRLSHMHVENMLTFAHRTKDWFIE